MTVFLRPASPASSCPRQGEPLLDGPSASCRVVLEEYLRCRGATWSSRDMLELIRLKSLAGGGPGGSPSEGPSTSTAASTPRGEGAEGGGGRGAGVPGSARGAEAAGRQPRGGGCVRGLNAVQARRFHTCADTVCLYSHPNCAGPMSAVGDAAQAADNRSFYGHDSGLGSSEEEDEGSGAGSRSRRRRGGGSRSVQWARGVLAQCSTAGLPPLRSKPFV